MMNFLKKLLNRYNLLIIVVVLLAFFIRFYNFQNRILFGPEQAISLETSADMLRNKISLLGIENVQRTTSAGLKIFSGALFSYSLIPILFLTNNNPILITAYFAILNIFTGLVIFFIANKMFNKKMAILSTIFFLFNNYMIYHSMFIWILNYLPLIGVVSFYLLYKQKLKNSLTNLFWLGIVSGIGFSLEYLYFLTILFVFLIIIKISRKRLVSAVVFAVGLVPANIPAILFDLKHDFYHIRTLDQYLIDTVYGRVSAGIFAYYDFLQFWPILMIVFAYLVYKLSTKNKIVAFVIVILYLFLNLTSNLISINTPIGMPKDLTYKNIYLAAKYIKDDNPSNFNVAVLADFDSRGHILRYPLEYQFNIWPRDVKNYSNIDSLYVLAKSGYNFSDSQTYEIYSFKPFLVKNLSAIGAEYSLFKLNHAK